MKSARRARLLGAVGLSALCFCLAQANAADVNEPAVAKQTVAVQHKADKKEIAPPSAQSNAAPTSAAQEEIVVTARRRSESLKDVPAQVSAFTAQTIENKGVEMPRDFLSAVPNVTLVETQNAGNAFIVVRGITQARNSEPSVAIVVDGVPETQPAQFNQELVDIQQIEVLKGPQGALYGRDAIGGAILITTKEPSDHWEGRVTAGYENGPGGKGQGVISGPITDTLKMRAALSFTETDGHIPNAFLHKDADPLADWNGRLSFLYKPNDNFSADLRLSGDVLHTKALYFVVPSFGPTFSNPLFNDPNNTADPILANNPGKNDRQLYGAALKLAYNTDLGTFTSITGLDSTREILTGDAYDFKPINQTQIGFDINQAQFLKVTTWSQELRFTSPTSGRFRWVAGAQAFGTQRFISTGNMFDTGAEQVVPVYKVPFPQFGTVSFANHSQVTFLVDSQHQFAWAGYIDTSTEITKQLELSLNLRYDNDHRTNTTDTPQEFLDANGITGRAAIPAHTGDKRSHTWDDWQPQAILRYAVTPDLNVYASYSRGFRSGGFNQTGVATAALAAGFAGVGDIFDQETADTYEAGFKSQFWDRRVSFNGSYYYTIDRGSYYFVFLASNSTQNLGNIAKSHLQGVDFDATAQLTDELSVNLGYGYTDSKIKAFSDPTVIGSKDPLVPQETVNAGVQYLAPITNGINGLIRLDYNRIGKMYFTIPLPALGALDAIPKARHPIDLVDLRAGLQGESWSLMFWSKNLFDRKYNAEYSPGGFLFKAQPIRWGFDLTKKF
ncbi:MAG: TonB-dependent receptor [Alphaproteobacteria bacterium]